MPTRRHGHAAVALHGKILVLGGYGAEREIATVERYDPAADAWSTCAPLPIARGFLGAAAVNGHVFAVGGHTGDRPLERYDPRGDHWVALAPLPETRDRFGLALAGGYLFLCGGEHELRTVLRYRPELP